MKFCKLSKIYNNNPPANKYIFESYTKNGLELERVIINTNYFQKIRNSNIAVYNSKSAIHLINLN